jgi:hypothetical protein
MPRLRRPWPTIVSDLPGTRRGAAAQCVTVGRDEDPEAHTPAVELQPCAARVNDASFAEDGQEGWCLLYRDASGGGDVLEEWAQLRCPF